MKRQARKLCDVCVTEGACWEAARCLGPPRTNIEHLVGELRDGPDGSLSSTVLGLDAECRPVYVTTMTA